MMNKTTSLCTPGSRGSSGVGDVCISATARGERGMASSTFLESSTGDLSMIAMFEALLA